MADAGKVEELALYQEMASEAEAMVRHALGRGHEVPPKIVDVVARAHSKAGEGSERPTVIELAKAHGKLAKIVAPAQP
ncbi:MAG: hypothetical protein KC431_29230, partial [Myxococcales bacterium]|nr:hypothetical protein [Myxococcales bacterium]